VAATYGRRVSGRSRVDAEASAVEAGGAGTTGRSRSEIAHAKLNLGLAVIARRGDGYHEIETLMARISLADEVRVRLTGTPGVTFEASYEEGAAGAVRAGAALPSGSDNLAVRAAESYLTGRHAQAPRSADVGVHITLAKRIPIAAGLGGGSSDAAAVLRALASLLPSEVDVARLARDLGSDVPFFLLDAPLAVARGRGERLTPLEPPVDRGGRRWVLVNPGFGVSAREAYEALVGFSPRLRVERVLGRLAAGEDPGWSNALQPGVLRLRPQVREVLASLRDAALRGVVMSGSGPTCFGVAVNEAEAEAAAAALRAAHPAWWTSTVALAGE
jgi:4-diphosphocytidyl-2-C-methyl-D-erythritol kinase